MTDAHLFIVFGATGDLMLRKLLPALYDFLQGDPSECRAMVLGTSLSDLDEDAYQKAATQALVGKGIPEEEARRWTGQFLRYQPLREQGPEGYRALRRRIESLEKEHDLPGNRVFYLAVPPRVFVDAVERLGAAGLNRSEPGWTRLVIEKPFGQDLPSARSLNRHIHRFFSEDQIYRIDHYLGKETVQNLMVFRFGNAIFESLWNREHIERVDILVAEDLGVGSRAGYFDGVGTFRDMIQNHLTQILTLVGMEVPAVAGAEAIRHEKIKVLQSIRTVETNDAVFGQYTRGKLDGEATPGYREESGIASDSDTETYVALRLSINNWRWQGVPFVLQTGKRLPRRLTRIAVTFRRPPVMLFRSYDECRLAPNVLLITLQPDEGFSLSFEVKEPGSEMSVTSRQLAFRYEDAFGVLPDAYRTLLEDVVHGDQTLFVHAEEAEDAWRLYTPLLEERPPIHFYAAGAWGPPEARRLLEDTPEALYA